MKVGPATQRQTSLSWCVWRCLSRRVAANDIPARYRPLLVHTLSMTLMLEPYVAGPVSLRTLRSQTDHVKYQRLVILSQQSTSRPLEMGELNADLTLLPGHVSEQVLQEAVPFGRVLVDNGLEHESRPRAFFRPCT